MEFGSGGLEEDRGGEGGGEKGSVKECSDDIEVVYPSSKTSREHDTKKLVGGTPDLA